MGPREEWSIPCNNPIVIKDAAECLLQTTFNASTWAKFPHRIWYMTWLCISCLVLLFHYLYCMKVFDGGTKGSLWMLIRRSSGHSIFRALPRQDFILTTLTRIKIIAIKQDLAHHFIKIFNYALWLLLITNVTIYNHIKNFYKVVCKSMLLIKIMDFGGFLGPPPKKGGFWGGPGPS